MIIFFVRRNWYIRDLKKYSNCFLIAILDFIISANICYNLVWIITHDIQLKWDFNCIKSLFSLNDVGLLFGTTLLSLLIFLFILKYDKDIKLKFFRKKDCLKKMEILNMVVLDG